MQNDIINKENIAQLVSQFYPKIIQDPIVGPYFTQRLGSDINSQKWQEHLELLTNFWTMQALGDMSYHGSPLAPHFSMSGLDKESFQRWLELFYETIDEVYTPSVGAFFKERSSNIARNFMINLGIS
jgi:hemoglobin